MTPIDPFIRNTHIAYFSMEIALRAEMHTYAGGLGVLAGDTVRSCADLELPVVFVTLISRAGYFRQEIDVAGRQMEHEDPWDPGAWSEPLGVIVSVEIETREVWIRPRLYIHRCPYGNSIPVLLLDTNLDENAAEDRWITNQLYGGDEEYRLKQEIVLGIGGVRILQALGFAIATYHLNEGHSALLTIELLRRFRRSPRVIAEGESVYDAGRVRELCIFTTHTPVEAGHDRFPYSLVNRVMGGLVEASELTRLAGEDSLNMTRLALELSGYVNGVARRHAKTAKRMYPGYQIKAITNGVHVASWVHESFAELYHGRFPHWAHEPECLICADQLEDAAIWSAHEKARGGLLELVRKESGVRLMPDWPIIGFARRMTSYKRPLLLFHDIDRLARIAEKYRFQLVISGKAHPRDAEGKQLIENIHAQIHSLANRIPMAYIPDYDLEKARVLVAGCDIWLNTPEPPLEASGTSGMKAALNGVLNISVLDGWWIEACIEGVTGWSIGTGEVAEDMAADARSLYEKLDADILPLYFRDRARWIWMMKQSISKIGSRFNSQRMMRRYATEAYIR